MKLKLFGKELFKARKKEKWETHLYDFTQHGSPDGSYGNNVAYKEFVTVESAISGEAANKIKAKKKVTKQPITPKELYVGQTLNDTELQLKVDPEYIAKEQKILQKKIDLMFGKEMGSKWGRIELASLIERLDNRLSIATFKEVIDKYPYTTTAKVNDIVKAHDHLRFKEASEFIPDLPEEAIDAMAEYKAMCQSLCKKDPIFYIIADKKDFGEKDRRRDPILLVQSPFGFVWQILGAWGEEEMLYLGDL